jgi:UDP-glucose 4-epimerase
MSKMILVTGGAGYIGSHTVIELLAADYRVVIIDNLSNSSLESLKRVETITGVVIPFVRGDISDQALVRAVIEQYKPDATIHFAALKAVGESVAQPLKYYQNNIAGTLSLLEVLAQAGVKKFVFSSSATVYGDPETVPLTESSRTGPTNPYGQTKWMQEVILNDLAKSDPQWGMGILRYFNPAGAHESGIIGEDPNGIPNNLLPFVAQVAIGRREKLNVFGGDWPTIDGTGVRDFIHVVDLAKGHVAALNRLFAHAGSYTVNLGTGTGYSVLEMVAAFEKASGRPVPYEISPRRAGDIAECYADPSKSFELLGWKAEKGVQAMCEDAWRWQSKNPNGFK